MDKSKQPVIISVILNDYVEKLSLKTFQNGRQISEVLHLKWADKIIVSVPLNLYSGDITCKFLHGLVMDALNKNPKVEVDIYLSAAIITRPDSAIHKLKTCMNNIRRKRSSGLLQEIDDD